MAGLTRVKYVLVYPEQNDVVLAGPAEGWRVDALGNVVGASSGQPVLLLDDLMVALRVAEQANMTASAARSIRRPKACSDCSRSPARSRRAMPRNVARQHGAGPGSAEDHGHGRAGDEPFRPHAGGGRLQDEAAGHGF